MRFVQAGVMLLGTAMYLVDFLYPWRGDEFGDSSALVPTVFIVWNASLIIVTILVIIDSVKKVRKGMAAQLATGVFIVKLAAIPYFLINFALFFSVGAMGIGMVLMARGSVLVLALIAGSVVLTYLTMLSTSVYGWASITVLRRKRRVGTVLSVLYAILLFVFVADIVAGILLFAHSRRGKKALVAAQGASIES